MVAEQGPRSVGQSAKQIGAAGERDIDQVSPASQTDGTEVRPTGEDGIVKHHASVALHTPPIKIPVEDAVLDEQAGIEVGIPEVGNCNATAGQLHDLVESAPFEINPVQRTPAHDDGLVDATQVLPAEPSTHDEWVEVEQIGNPRILNGFADAQVLKHLGRRRDPQCDC